MKKIAHNIISVLAIIAGVALGVVAGGILAFLGGIAIAWAGAVSLIEQNTDWITNHGGK